MRISVRLDVDGREVEFPLPDAELDYSEVGRGVLCASDDIDCILFYEDAGFDVVGRVGLEDVDALDIVDFFRTSGVRFTDESD